MSEKLGTRDDRMTVLAHGHGAAHAFRRGFRHETHACVRQHVCAQALHFGLGGGDERLIACIGRGDGRSLLRCDAVREAALDEAAVLPDLIDRCDREGQFISYVNFLLAWS